MYNNVGDYICAYLLPVLRDYISVDYAAQYMSKIALQNDITGIINCCSGKPVSVRRFAENYFNERGVSVKLNCGHYPYQEFDPLAFWGNSEKLAKIIGKLDV